MGFLVKDECIFNHNRCCHIAFQKDCINTYFQPEMYYESPHIPFSNKDCCCLIFPSDPCKLMSHCGFIHISLIACEFEPLFTYLLATWNCFFVNCLFISLAQFSVVVFILVLFICFVRVLCIL